MCVKGEVGVTYILLCGSEGFLLHVYAVTVCLWLARSLRVLTLSILMAAVVTKWLIWHDVLVTPGTSLQVLSETWVAGWSPVMDIVLVLAHNGVSQWFWEQFGWSLGGCDLLCLDRVGQCGMCSAWGPQWGLSVYEHSLNILRKHVESEVLQTLGGCVIGLIYICGLSLLCCVLL